MREICDESAVITECSGKSGIPVLIVR